MDLRRCILIYSNCTLVCKYYLGFNLLPLYFFPIYMTVYEYYLALVRMKLNVIGCFFFVMHCCCSQEKVEGKGVPPQNRKVSLFCSISYICSVAKLNYSDAL